MNQLLLFTDYSCFIALLAILLRGAVKEGPYKRLDCLNARNIKKCIEISRKGLIIVKILRFSFAATVR